MKYVVAVMVMMLIVLGSGCETLDQAKDWWDNQNNDSTNSVPVPDPDPQPDPITGVAPGTPELNIDHGRLITWGNNFKVYEDGLVPLYHDWIRDSVDGLTDWYAAQGGGDPEFAQNTIYKMECKVRTYMSGKYGKYPDGSRAKIPDVIEYNVTLSRDGKMKSVLYQTKDCFQDPPGGGYIHVTNSKGNTYSSPTANGRYAGDNYHGKQTWWR